ncbi:MAG: hypothetical protein ACRENP_20875 [Longimicrobiales bacterium]
METDAQEPEQPRAPPMRRPVRLYPYQWLTLPLLIAIPIAALTGVLGERRELRHVSGSGLDVRSEVPLVMRYGQLQPLRLWITNRSTDPLDSLVLDFDSAYIARFVRVRFVPANVQPFVVSLGRLAPGATVEVLVELEAARYGRHRGTLRIMQSGRQPRLAIPVHTWILP